MLVVEYQERFFYIETSISTKVGLSWDRASFFGERWGSCEILSQPRKVLTRHVIPTLFYFAMANGTSKIVPTAYDFLLPYGKKSATTFATVRCIKCYHFCYHTVSKVLPLLLPYGK